MILDVMLPWLSSDTPVSVMIKDLFTWRNDDMYLRKLCHVNSEGLGFTKLAWSSRVVDR